MIGITEHGVDTELGIEGECGSLIMVAVAVSGSMGRRAVVAVRLAVDRDSETARECEYGHQDDRGECAAHEDTPLRRGIGHRVADLDGTVQRPGAHRPATLSVPRPTLASEPSTTCATAPRSDGYVVRGAM